MLHVQYTGFRQHFYYSKDILIEIGKYLFYFFMVKKFQSRNIDIINSSKQFTKCAYNSLTSVFEILQLRTYISKLW